MQEELRCLGAANLAAGRRHGLMSPAVKRILKKEAGEGKRFSVTLELVQGHGWKGELRPSGQNSGDDYSISVESLRGSWRGKIAHSR